jgi:hypothetical protein
LMLIELFTRLIRKSLLPGKIKYPSGINNLYKTIKMC